MNCCYEKLVFRIKKITLKFHIFVSSDSLRPGRSRYRIPVGRRDFSCTSLQALGPMQLPVHWVPGPFPGVKRLGSRVDHPPPPSAEVKYTPITHMGFRGLF